MTELKTSPPTAKHRHTVTAVWPVLFKYAHNMGQARLTYKDFPSEENKLLLDEAIKKHEDYRQICLGADHMIGLDMNSILANSCSGE